MYILASYECPGARGAIFVVALWVLFCYLSMPLFHDEWRCFRFL
jgi:hypothetical protein